MTNAETEIEETANGRWLQYVRDLMASVAYRDDTYRYRVEIDQADPHGRVFIQLEHLRPDAFTGELKWGNGGKRYLSPFMTTSEIIRAAFAAALAYEEHEVREWFTYHQRRVFGPHIDVDALWTVANDLDIRS
ncbi:MAG: hypothetical protein JWR85_4071 [Marmoricola sp.]|nr:hypothetical protein [Marmoricola sp.]